MRIANEAHLLVVDLDVPAAANDFPGSGTPATEQRSVADPIRRDWPEPGPAEVYGALVGVHGEGIALQVPRGRIEVSARLGRTPRILHLPDAGLRGNSHFMFSDLNNVEVADQLTKFLQRHGLDAR